MAATELAEISRSIKSALGESSGGFRKAANDNNAVIGKLNRDLGRYFASMKSQLSELNETSSEMSQNIEKLVSKTDRFSSVLSDSVSIQNQLYNEMRNVVSGVKVLNGGFGQLQNSIAGAGTSTLLGKIGLLVDIFGGAAKSLVTIATIVESGKLISREIGAGGGESGAGGAGDGGGGGSVSPTPGSGGKYSPAQAAALIKSVGGTPQEAQLLGAISKGESSGNPNTHNRQGRDDSYGLWQINMLGSMGPERLKHYNLNKPEDLFDPKTNARVALQLLRENKGQPYPTWGAYRDMHTRGEWDAAYKAAGEGAYGSPSNSGSESSQTTPQQATPQAQTPLHLQKPEGEHAGLASGSSHDGHNHGGAEKVTSGSVGNHKEQDDAKNTATPENKGGGGNVIQAQSGIRHLPLNNRTLSMLQSAASAAGVTVKVTSGAQPDFPRGPRTGSTRHDQSVGAADVDLISNGRVLGNAGKDVEIKKKFVEAAFAAGATGIGAGEGYMGGDKLHVGFGKPAIWGGTKGHDSAYPWLKQAYASRGGSGPGTGAGQTPSAGGGSTTPSGGGGGETTGGGVSDTGTGGGESPTAEISPAAVSALTGGALSSLSEIQSEARNISGLGSLGGMMGGFEGVSGSLGGMGIGMNTGSLLSAFGSAMENDDAKMMPTPSQTSMNVEQLNNEAVAHEAMNQINSERAAQNAVIKAEEDNNLYNANIREGMPIASDYNRPEDKMLAPEWMHGIEYRGYREFNPLKYG